MEFKKEVLSQSVTWNEIENSYILSLAKLREEKDELRKVQKMDMLEEISRRQKSREVWLKEGDRNSRCFHKMANAHRKKKIIFLGLKLMENGLGRMPG